MYKTTDKIQVLVATMNQNDFSKIEELRIDSDVILANQANTTRFDMKKYNSFVAQMITTNTRGVGINRNLALQYATGDILLISDDDMVFFDSYVEKVHKAFSEHPDADAIIFNIHTIGGEMERRINKKSFRIHMYNCLNYGAARIAVRRNSLIQKRITFSTCFGGGTIYSAGEDSLFICDMLRNGFKIYTSPDFIATVDQTSSTWFNGYDKKYLYDKGAFYKAAFGKWSSILCMQDLCRHKYIYKDTGLGILEAFRIMKKGCKGYSDMRKWELVEGSFNE